MGPPSHLRDEGTGTREEAQVQVNTSLPTLVAYTSAKADRQTVPRA